MVIVSGYKLKNGYYLSEEEVEKRAQEWEDGTWKGSLVELHPGRPRLSEEPNANMSFKCPESAAAMIEDAARVVGVKKSAFIRQAAIEKAASVLGESFSTSR